MSNSQVNKKAKMRFNLLRVAGIHLWLLSAVLGSLVCSAYLKSLTDNGIDYRLIYTGIYIF